jgi:high-affinity iron transporter
MVDLRSVFSLLTLVIVTAGGISAASAADEGDEHQLIGVLDYIAVDYAEAVEDGQVVDDFEYKEMQTLASEAARLAGSEESIASQITSVDEAITQKKAPDIVRARATKARRAVVEHFDLVLSPKRPPSFEHGEKLYRANCTSCHGDDGLADVPAAKEMKPTPSNFTDPETRENLSPYRVFNTTTFGIDGTPMRAFGELSADERWDIAFYVLALAHGTTDAQNDNSYTKPPEGFDESLEALASRTDAELVAALRADDSAANDLAGQLAYLRQVEPFEAEATSHDEAFVHIDAELDAAERAWKNGDFDRARALVMSAYLEGFELVESRLSASDAALTHEIESLFFSLRERLEKRDADGADAKLTMLEEELGEARELLQAGASSWTLGVASAVILLREGVEVVLLIGLLLGVLRRLGAAEERKYVHIGWAGALLAGVATWFAASTLIEISGAQRELLEGVVGILAAAVLFSVSYWFVGKLQGERWTTFIKEQIEAKVTAGRVFSLAGLAFLAVYREAFETVLFYKALALEADGNFSPILLGAGAAALVLAAVAFLILRAGAKLPLKPFFALSAGLLYALCIVLMGNGIHALSEAGILPLVRVPFVEIPALGVYPDAFGIAAQGALALAAAIWLVVSRSRDAAE